jgi:hypothetical protein
MTATITAIDIPSVSQLFREAPGAYFHDCYQVELRDDSPSALALFLAVANRTPRWVDRLMGLRNRIVSKLGLKDLGLLHQVDPNKPLSAYRVGDRVGIFTLLHLSDDEVVLGDADKHLDVKVSVCKLRREGRDVIASSTVVQVHNALGRAYMLFVAPVHRRIAPAMLAQSPHAAGQGTRGA